MRGTIVRRDKLAYDTRFAAAVAGKPEKVGHVYLVVNGRYAPAAGEPLHGPVGLMLADDEIERLTPKSRTFRTDGDHDPRHPPAVRPRATSSRRSAWRQARSRCRPRSGMSRAPRSTIRTERSARYSTRSRATASRSRRSRIHDEPERYRRLWDALRPLYETYGGTVSLKQLAASLDMSMRQVGRDAKELAATFGFGSGYRDALLVLRLRVAVLLLSAPDSTVAEVATAVGYGSPIAMARAFRDAKLAGAQRGASRSAFRIESDNTS